MSSKTKAFFFALAVFFALPTLLLAQTSYTLSAPIPGGAPTVGAAGDVLGDYVAIVFPFALSAAVALALIMIVVGGLQYVAAAGNPAQISDAKSRILHAISGLLLITLTVIILQTINPSLLSMDLGLAPITIEHVDYTPTTN